MDRDGLASSLHLLDCYRSILAIEWAKPFGWEEHGGVNAGNLADYVKAGAWAVGGTWMCKKELIEAGNFAKISELVKEALSIMAEARK